MAPACPTRWHRPFADRADHRATGFAASAAGLAVLGAIVGSVIFYEIFSRGGEHLLARYTSSGRGSACAPGSCATA